MVEIRTIRESDAERFVELGYLLANETPYMLPMERSVERQRNRIQTVLTQDNQVIYVCEDDPCLVGYVAAFGRPHKNNRHSAYLVIGIAQVYTGLGIGTRLMQTIDTWARRRLHRLELTVICQNTPAVHLYKKFGFQIEGTKCDSIFIDGKYVDEYYMAKLF